ncbi:DUF120 domain-containing protein, partial [Candidatus Woesearchaeota archaeon]|nr:DUF120 domain-containing protein [Candidatus Woesearchaeota archaeon]
GISQQSISRKLRELEDERYIERKPSTDGIRVRLTGKAVGELKGIYFDMKKLFSPDDMKKSLQGTVTTGLGEGRFYTEIAGYKSQFIELLGINPFPGTLNLNVAEVEKEEFLFNRKSIYVNGFESKARSYGALICYPVTIKEIKAAIVVPDRTMHRSGIIELISETDIRKELKLVDGDKVNIECL